MLVLWDIDHTLIDTGGVGSEIYATAFQEVTGRSLEKMADVSGRTEPVIFRETLKMHGIDAPADLFDTFAEHQARGYAERADEMRERGRALPGVPEALRAIAAEDDLIQSVLTGNTRPSSESKAPHFRAGRLSRPGQRRLRHRRRHPRQPGRHRTPARQQDPWRHLQPGNHRPYRRHPNDVIAARDGGARIIAVATGKDSADDLAAAGAEHGVCRPDRHRRPAARHP